MRIDTTGCECLGECCVDMTTAIKYVSICWDCLVPTRKCSWLLFCKMYENSKYYVAKSKIDGKLKQQVGYRIVECPRYKGDKDE